MTFTLFKNYAKLVGLALLSIFFVCVAISMLFDPKNKDSAWFALIVPLFFIFPAWKCWDAIKSEKEFLQIRKNRASGIIE